jgi:hypothetical protein
MIEMDQVWCDHHGDIHDKSPRPYDGCPTETRDGRPVWLRYADVDEDGTEVTGRYGENPKVKTIMVEMEPECGPDNWRVLWAGRLMA